MQNINLSPVRQRKIEIDPEILKEIKEQLKLVKRYTGEDTTRGATDYLLNLIATVEEASKT